MNSLMGHVTDIALLRCAESLKTNFEDEEENFPGKIMEKILRFSLV